MQDRRFREGDRVRVTNDDCTADHVAPKDMGRVGTVFTNQSAELSPVEVRLDGSAEELRFRSDDLNLLYPAEATPH